MKVLKPKNPLTWKVSKPKVAITGRQLKHKGCNINLVSEKATISEGCRLHLTKWARLASDEDKKMRLNTERCAPLPS